MTTFQAIKTERLTPRSIATRAKLVAVAERLFADRSIESVSLNEINRAAGQRNSNACQYHFGNKDGLLQAIIDKHVAAIASRRNEMLDRLEASGNNSIRDVIKAFVYPVAEQLCKPDGGKEFVRITAQLIVPHTLIVQQQSASTLRVQGAERLVRALRNAVAGFQLPEPVIMQRLLLAAMLLYHGFADHSRVLDATQGSDPINDTDLFVNNVVDSMVAILSAPLSTDTQACVQTLTTPSAVTV